MIGFQFTKLEQSFVILKFRKSSSLPSLLPKILLFFKVFEEILRVGGHLMCPVLPLGL